MIRGTLAVERLRSVDVQACHETGVVRRVDTPIQRLTTRFVHIRPPRILLRSRWGGGESADTLESDVDNFLSFQPFTRFLKYGGDTVPENRRY